MNAFIIMPFAKKYNKVWQVIKQVCKELGINDVRGDEIKDIGPIINQIFNSISNADLVIAEISEKNPNVYYEVGVSHTIGKPTALLAQKEFIKSLPFDIQHNRVFGYDIKNPDGVKEELIDKLGFLKETIASNAGIPSVDAFLNSLNFNKRGALSDPVKEVVDYIGKNFNLTCALLDESEMLPEGFLITVKDAFEQKIRVLVDINGIIKRVKRLA